MQFYKKILFVLISCCFWAAATETDIGPVHQTFFDEYDTYIPAEKQNVSHAVAQQVLPCDPVLCGGTLGNDLFSNYPPQVNHFHCYSFYNQRLSQKKRIYLLNSALIV